LWFDCRLAWFLLLDCRYQICYMVGIGLIVSCIFVLRTQGLNQSCMRSCNQIVYEAKSSSKLSSFGIPPCLLSVVLAWCISSGRLAGQRLRPSKPESSAADSNSTSANLQMWHELNSFFFCKGWHELTYFIFCKGWHELTWNTTWTDVDLSKHMWNTQYDAWNNSTLHSSSRFVRAPGSVAFP
jgi:hypothetical protein